MVISARPRTPSGRSSFVPLGDERTPYASREELRATCFKGGPGERQESSSERNGAGFPSGEGATPSNRRKRPCLPRSFGGTRHHHRHHGVFRRIPRGFADRCGFC